jgi:hypothetical protein
MAEAGLFLISAILLLLHQLDGRQLIIAGIPAIMPRDPAASL